MAKLPQDFIDDLLTRVDLVEVIDARVPLKKAGREYVACCPFHSEKTPSFTVSPLKQFYHCFGCGAHGTAIGFLMDYEHMGFLEAVQELASRAGVPLPEYTTGDSEQRTNQELYGLIEEAALFFRHQLKSHPEGNRAIGYLKQRGLDGTTARTFGMGYAPPGWNNLMHALEKGRSRSLLATAGLIIDAEGKQYDRFRDRVMFPIRDTRGRVIGFGGRVLGDETPKYLNSPETPVFHKGHELYGLYEARQALRALPRLLVVEGYMDVVALAQFEVRYAVATLGTAVTREHLERLFRASSEVVFCFDGDRAGREAAWRGLENAMPLMHEGRQLRFMFLAEGDDPDTLIREIGRDAFEQKVEEALPLSQFFFEQLRQRVDLSRLEGRAKLVELARPLLSNMPDGVYRRMMAERLAEVARVEPAQLRDLFGSGALPKQRGSLGSLRGKQPSLVRQAIGLLLQDPGMAAKAGPASQLAGLRLPGAGLLMELIELLQERPHINTAGLLEHWRGTEEERHLLALARRPPLLDPGASLEEEFLDALRRLCQQQQRQRLEELREKPFKELLPEEKVELQQLLMIEIRHANQA